MILLLNILSLSLTRSSNGTCPVKTQRASKDTVRSPDWGRIHYYGLNNLVVKFSGEQNCLCFMVCKLESFAGIPNRHLLQSGLSQSDQLAAHHTGCSTTEAQSRSPGEPPRKPESTWRPRWKGPFGIQIGFGRSHNGLLSISCSLQCFFLALMYRRLATEASLRCLATSSFHQGAGGPFLRLMVFSTVLFLMILFKSVIKSSTSAMELRLVSIPCLSLLYFFRYRVRNLFSSNLPLFRSRIAAPVVTFALPGALITCNKYL
ncbi:uncharacterized protein LOC123988812 isoform X3 [Osmia bicornis bicornis]|uniref:uncharacterized protein LOC123988812 isoform X3 n=1 Tax=Osmia bicornis bicornis TaxID=1437191 RepID=UPI001EAE8A5F|nr:uncharacterized protein LOC123988812 isoform X3 [Osmia bicornis bicornis]